MTTIDRDSIAIGILEAARATPEVSARDIDRLERVMEPPRWAFRRWRVRERVIDEALDSMLAASVIVATPEGVQPAMDWSAILDFLKEMLPVILQIIALF